jgi:hypothetical protein
MSVPHRQSDVPSAATLLVSLFLATAAAGAPVAQKLLPDHAPLGARVLVIGTGLNTGLVFTFTGSGGTRVPAEIVSESESVVELVVPPTAVSGTVAVKDSTGGGIGSLPFVITPDAPFASVSTLTSRSSSRVPSALVAVLADGRLFMSDTQGQQILEISATSEVTVFAGSGAMGYKDGPKATAEFKAPRGVAYDAARGLLYVADAGNHAIRAVSVNGTVSTLAGSGHSGDRDGTGTQAELNSPTGIALDRAGNIYVADTGNHKIRKVTPAGVVTTVAGNGDKTLTNGPAANAGFNDPEGILVTRSGAVLVSDTKNHAIRRIEGGVVSTVAGTGKSGFADGPATTAALNEPRGLAEDDAGNLLVADAQGARIRKITPAVSAATVTTVAGNGKLGLTDGAVASAEFKEPSGVAFAGAIYVADAANGVARVLWPQLRVTAIYPSSGGAPGIPVRVFGAGFVAGRTTIAFGTETPRAAVYVNSTEVLIPAPPAGGGAVNVTVTTPGGTDVLPSAYTGDVDPPLIIASVSGGARSADGWYHQPATVYFTCADVGSGIASCTAPVTLSSDGPNQSVSGTAVDRVGLSASATSTVNIDATPPVLTLAVTPQVTNLSSIALSGSASDALSGLSGVTCNGRAAAVAGQTFACTVELLEGINELRIVASDRAGGEQTRIIAIRRDVTPPELTIAAPVADAAVNAPNVAVEVTARDEDQIGSITINGIAATAAGDTYRATVSVVDGRNEIVVVASDRAGNETRASRFVSYFSLPTVAITAPADLAVVNTAVVTVSGNASGAGTVTVNGASAAISGGHFTIANVPLVQGRTVITAEARNAGGHVATTSIHVYRDALPPRVAVYAPADGEIVSSSPIIVSGMVDDVAVGTINSGQASVTVNGIGASVANRAFLAHAVALQPGDNTLTVVATDQSGNQATLVRHVTLDAGAGLPKIVVVSGDDQSASIGGLLAAPLVVRLTDAAGTPVLAREVTFNVIENNGLVDSGAKRDRSVAVATNAAGLASVRWTLGSRAGAGNQRVVATATGFAGKAAFTASGVTGVPQKIVVDAGGSQFGVIGQRLHRPLIAAVVDKGGNRVANTAVVFAVAQGGGSIDGRATISVSTDSDGRAWVVPTLGPDAGPDRNVFTATIAGQTSYAAFYATGRPAGPVEETRISGTVVDNTNIPIEGVSVRIEGSSLTAQSDAQGRFTIAQAPVGYVKLIIDGSTAQRAGTWPTLEFAMYTNPGQDNTLGMPIYILPLDIARGIQVNEQKGGTLTLPELPGFSLTIAPGSATFPNGARSGTVSVTLVHSDKMPMPPGFGQQPRFIVTIQPTGVHFDPPAAITFPNVDGLAPGEITELYSFDHDLGQFVSIGTGAISDDGTTLRSDPGVGIIKGGWHCGGNPTPTGTSAHCNDCAKCNGGVCEPDPLKIGTQCKGDSDPCTDDVCVNGVCTHPPLQTKVALEAQYVDHDDARHTWADAAALVLGQPLYGSDSVESDQVRWSIKLDTKKPILSYHWTAMGPSVYTGPAAPQWQLDNINWTPGFYVIRAEVTFVGGCKVLREWGQYVGVRTQDYILYGAIRPQPESTVGVSPATLDKWKCSGITNTQALALAIAGAAGGFNNPVSPAFVPEDDADRFFTITRLLNLTADKVPVPTNLDVPREGTCPNCDSQLAFGVSPDDGYRQALHAQFKYLVHDGLLVGAPLRVGDVYSITGHTPAPCTTALLWADGEEDSRNDKLEVYPDRTGFAYVLKIRGGSSITAAQWLLTRRELSWVFFRFRFDTKGATLRSNLTDSSDSWDGSDDRDFSPAPTFYLYRRTIDTHHYVASLLWTRTQDIAKFLAIPPKLAGSVGPFYPK